MATIDDLRSWAQHAFQRFGGFDKSVEVIRWNAWNCQFRVYTETNCYTISAHNPDGSGSAHSCTDGYLGCTASARKPRAGEYWMRGNILANGALSAETWHAVLADIVAYEIVKVHHRQVGDAPAPRWVPWVPPALEA